MSNFPWSLAILLASAAREALAQSTIFYGANGQHLGTSTTTGNTTTLYGPNGTKTGSATTLGNTTTFYGPNGQRTGSATNRHNLNVLSKKMPLTPEPALRISGG